MSGDNSVVKIVELKWSDKKSSPKKYNFRPRKQREKSPKKLDNKQKKIDAFFAVSPDRKFLTPKTPVKKTSAFESSSPEDLYLSPSAKFDSLVPKVADILKARADQEKFKKIDAVIKESSKRFLDDINRKLEFPESKIDEGLVEFKNCKHLTNAQITRKFRKDKKFVDDLFHGRVKCERFEMFKRDTPLNNGTKDDLRVNDTNIAFTQDQLIHIVQLFRERYDNGNMYKYSDFYFKVLLPEYCLKIFCDVYKMGSADALDYLKKVPVHDIFS